MTAVQDVCGADQTSRVHWEGKTLTVTQQRVRPVPAEGWTVVDGAGHLHESDSSSDPFPTLTRVSDGWADPCENPDCLDEIERYHLACPECGEKIWPSPAGPATDPLPGEHAYWIDGERVSRHEALAFVALIREGDRDRYERLRYWMKYSANLALPRPRATRD